MPKIPEAKRFKFDDKGERCIFVGYGDRVMGYKLYNPLTMKVVINNDVVFEEDQTGSQKHKIIHIHPEDAREIEKPDLPDSSLGPGTRPRKMCNLSDLYEATKEVDGAIEDNVNRICVYIDTDPALQKTANLPTDKFCR